jgi:hypothetical protein
MQILARVENNEYQVELTIHANNVSMGCNALRDWGYDVTPLSVKVPTKTKNNAGTQEERDALLAAIERPAAEKGLLFDVD